MLLTELARASRPDLPVVIGGMTSEAEARTFMKIFPYADFAVWGEGEIPLLSLLGQLEKKSPSLDTVPRLLYRCGNDLLRGTSTPEEVGDLAEDVYSDFFTVLSKLPAASGLPDIQISP